MASTIDEATTATTISEPKSLVQSSTKEDKPKPNSIIIYGIYTLFFSLFFAFVPTVVVVTPTVFRSFVGSFIFFNVLTPVITFALSHVAFYKSVPEKKRPEIVNRVNSIIFNLSVTPHTFAFYFQLGVLNVPPFASLLKGPVSVMDFFCGWSIGYVLYDFMYLVSVYGTNIPILLHHCAEMLILTAYVYDPPLGGIYTLSGAVMMISSAMLHIQRIAYLCKLAPSALFVIKAVLLVTWLGGRIVMSSNLMIIAFINLPITFLHIALLVAGSSLFGMNIFWAVKIARKNNLAF